ncbi:MAG TPA: TIGR03435 family protein [Acidobacteriaceae bacterium]
MRVTRCKRVSCSLLLAAVLLTGANMAVAQAVSPMETAKATVGPETAWKFDVVSMRRDMAGGPQYIGRPTADGYQMKNMVLGYLILMAYVPQTGGAAAYTGNQILGAPAWLGSDDDRYDVNAKVGAADLADWQNPAKQPAMMRSMLQAMLEDRLKLAVHRSTKEASVYLLVVGKGGPKFKETNPDELHPDARTMPGGGFLSREEEDGQMTVHYWAISIPQLARFVLGAERPIEDETGLTGKYDVTVHRPLPAAAQSGPSTDAAADPGPSVAEIAGQLGLKLEPAKSSVETLVIDHVERPSEN